MYSPATAGSIITACTVLHNIMVASKYPLPPESDILLEMDHQDDDDDLTENDTFPNNINVGNVLRQHLIREYFN